MIVKITSKRQVTFPKRIMEKLRLREGDTLTLSETKEGIVIKPHRFDRENLAPLHSKVRADLPKPDYKAVRYAALDPRLRD